MNYLMPIISLDTLEAFRYGSIFCKILFCSGEKQGWLVSDKCNTWYNKVGDLLMTLWNRRKEILHGTKSV